MIMPNFCPKCGTPLPDAVKFCPACGQSVAAGPAAQTQQSFVPPARPSPQGGFAQSYPNPAPQQGFQAQQGYSQPQSYAQQPQSYAQQPQPYRQPQYQAPYAQPPQKKSAAPLIIAIVAVVVLALAAVACFVWPGFLKSEEPAKTPQTTENGGTKPDKPTPGASTEAPTPATTAAPTQTEAPVLTNPFTNVEDYESDYEEFLWCYANGVYTETSIDREKALTRGEVMTMLWKAAGSPAPKGAAHGFTDVSKDMDCNTALIWAEETGVFTSAASPEFKPDEICTRGTALYVLFQFSGEDASSYPRAFVDTDEELNEYKISNWGFARGLVERDGEYCFNGGSELELRDYLCWLARLREPLYALYPMTLSSDGFEDYGMTEYVNSVGGEMEFVATTKNDSSIAKRLKISIEDYQTFDQAEGYEAREGYEWRVVTLLIDYAEAGAEDYSYSLYIGFYDYYNLSLFRNHYERLEDSDNSSAYIVYNNDLRDVVSKPMEYESVDGALFRVTEAIQVPWGYDGICVVVNGVDGQPSGTQSLEDVYADGQYHAIFRME